MTYIPITYIPDGPVTKALKKRVRGVRPKPKLGNLGPLLDEELVSARSDGHLRYRPADLRMLKDVSENPDVVDEGLAALAQVADSKGIVVPNSYEPEAPWYHDVPALLRAVGLIAVAMTVGITAAVVFLQNRSVAWMTVWICVISLAGALAAWFSLERCIIRVGPLAPTDHSGDGDDEGAIA